MSLVSPRDAAANRAAEQYSAELARRVDAAMAAEEFETEREARYWVERDLLKEIEEALAD